MSTNLTLRAPQTETLVELSRRYGVHGPRYTSYPTADRFSEAFGRVELMRALARRRERKAGGTFPPLSLYVHVPFCESVCYYCACNKVITRQHDRATEYLNALESEMVLQAVALGERQPASQLHLGGGSPTFLSDAELHRLLAALRRNFAVQEDAEVSIEVDPRTVDGDRLFRLRELGFNRISFGVQDFDPDVQQAVHRVQPYERVRELLLAARRLGFQSINTDLIYGLPRQTPQTFAETVRQVASLAPDRVSMYAYAHLPERFKPQRRIHSGDLPNGAQRLAMLAGAISSLTSRGYAYIGMDHFARPDDALAVAKREGRLHRNFQEYTTHPDSDLIGLGVSAIGNVGACTYQNTKTLPTYYESLREGRLPVERGLRRSADDLLRQDVIMRIMCQGQVDFGAVSRKHGVDVRRHLADEIDELSPMATQGLLTLTGEGFALTANGWYVVRAVAMVFDRYLRDERMRECFSALV